MAACIGPVKALHSIVGWEVVSKKKKKVFTEIETHFSLRFGNSNVRGGAVFLRWGLFSIFHKKSASKAPKTCDFAYFTSQWGGSSPPPPGYDTVPKLLGLLQFSKPLGLLWFWREDQNSEFPKTFFGETSFCIC